MRTYHNRFKAHEVSLLLSQTYKFANNITLHFEEYFVFSLKIQLFLIKNVNL